MPRKKFKVMSISFRESKTENAAGPNGITRAELRRTPMEKPKRIKIKGDKDIAGKPKFEICRVLLLSFMLSLMVGCSATYEFKIVDRKGLPLNNVKGDSITQGYYFGNRLFPHHEIHHHTTTQDGLIVFKGLGREPDFWHRFVFTSDGYENLLVTAGYRWGRYEVFSTFPGQALEDADHRDVAPAREGVTSTLVMYSIPEKVEKVKGEKRRDTGTQLAASPYHVPSSK